MFTGGADDGVDGTIVLSPGDVLLPFNTYVQTPVRLTVEKGFVTGIRGDYQKTPTHATPTTHCQENNSRAAQAAVRHSARAALDQHLRDLREQRTRRSANTGDDRNGSNASSLVGEL